MSDIVERLRLWEHLEVNLVEAETKMLTEASDEIEQLRTALEWIAHRCPKVYTASDDPHRAHVEASVDAGNCARAAVAEKGCTK